MSGKQTIKPLALGMALCLAGWSAGAQAATCGITGSASASPVTYDPFNPTGLGTTSITLNLTRINGTGGEKTDIVNFFLKSNNDDADGTSIVPTAVAMDGNYDGIGLDIFYDFAETPPIYAPTTVDPSPANRFLKLEFTGNNVASDTASVTFNVTLPANLDLNASTTLPFDAIFSCSTTGGGSPTQQTGSIANAVTFPITVLSALQASFVGTALDFGEIGNIDNAGAPAVNTGLSNYVRVQSSGAYTVELSSENAFRLKHPSGSLANPLDRVDYKLKFLGVERNNAGYSTPGATVINQQCARAGVPASEADILYIQGVLEEGGQGKTPSLGGTYLDTLTVTVTPQAIGVTYPTDCPSLGLP